MFVPAYALVLSLRPALWFDMRKKFQSTIPPRAFPSLKILALKVQTFHMKISYICTTKIIVVSRDLALTLVFKNRLSATLQLFRLAQSFLQTQEYLSNIDCVMTRGGGHNLVKFRISMIHRFRTSHPVAELLLCFRARHKDGPPNAIWFPRYFYLQANGIMYLECPEC